VEWCVEEPATIAGIMGRSSRRSGGGGKKGTRGEVVETEWATESGGSAQNIVVRRSKRGSKE
jgi:hypothetical protein